MSKDLQEVTRLINLYIEGAGKGNTTSKRQGRANPSLPLMFERNRLGENDIKIYPLILTILCFSFV